MSYRTSIIMPFLNAADFLVEAIESVKAQTIADWELLLVDDNSTDGSKEIADSAARDDPRIRLLSNPPGFQGGAASARNLALAGARGEFVCFLDADDVFLPQKLERQVAILEQFGEVALTFGPTQWWHPHEPKRDWSEPMRFRGVVSPPTLVEQTILMLQGHVPCICAVLIRRDAIEEVGGFEEQFRLYEDQTMWVKLMSVYPTYVDDVVTAKYRQHPASVSAEALKDGSYNRLGPHAARLPFLEWTRLYLADRQLIAPSTQQALRCAFAKEGKERSALTLLDRLLLTRQHLKRRVKTTSRRMKRLRQIVQGSR